MPLLIDPQENLILKSIYGQGLEKGALEGPPKRSMHPLSSPCSSHRKNRLNGSPQASGPSSVPRESGLAAFSLNSLYS